MTYLRLENITKRFGNFVANDNISLTVSRGSIHALLGENGAGKTTLMNILCGLYQPDFGEIYLEDRLIKISSPSDAIARNIAMIHQHFMLVPQLTVTENIILGKNWNWRLNLKQKAETISSLSKSYNLEVDPLAKVGDLPVGVQQRVEILKALYRQAQLLILDEPTAVLTPPEVEVLINILRHAANGKTIIFISHKLEEVMNLCDTVTVLRRGQVVATTRTADTNRQQLAELMVGRAVLFQLDKPAKKLGSVVLEVQGLQVQDDRKLLAVRDVSFQLHAGEILGIAGVDGNGQRELADALANLRPLAAGTISRFPPNPSSPRREIAYIPEDRQKMGLVLGFSIARNLILKVFYLLPFCRSWLLQYGIINDSATSAMNKFDIRAENPSVKVSQLSGGNQQKVVVARELSGAPDLIIAMQPTRGLDVGATEYLQQKLLAERERGAAILYISTELEEVMMMSDRIAVMYEGKFVDILDASNATVEQIGYLMTGGKVLGTEE
ncbi:ABC transporter ATP-binding protein [Microseira wollei]|uniref:ABC transporter-like protein n=1 Tax=Microseira wollei NIES-4236 TaxID=2530354 RepID=A0AAV3WZJ7_9CYAN|nr:ABC transporter ATP-binding protein [Microseira wollei]GET35807.1 ABC transporter-like protein [Microseira wollei NIES-4236]